MIKYFVRTTEERQLDKSYEQIDYELLIDHNHNSGKAFIEQLEIINDYNSVLLEDDLILCEGFKEKIEEAIKQYPDDIINFFTLPMKYFKTYRTKLFCYNQCTYFPKGMPKKIRNILLKHHYENTSQEQLMKHAFLFLRLTHIVYRPCLVQHIDKDSLMNHSVKFCRRSPFFVDYLNELGITYDDAKLKCNTEKLINLMKEKFKGV